MNRREFLKKSLEGIIVSSIPLISSCEKNPVSPDLESRKKIVFSSNRGGKYNIYTINLDGSDLKQLTYEGNNIFPAWSPDGKKVAFVKENRYPESVVSDIYVISVQGGTLV